MKVFTILFLFATFLFSKEYYAKVDPYEIRDISSNVSGLVLYASEFNIGKELSSQAYIRIDSELDTEELKYIQDKLSYLRETVGANEDILNNMEKSLKKKRDNYQKIESLKIKSVVEKDKDFHDLITGENQFLNTKKEINTLKVQITDLKLKEVQLKKNISDKNLIAEGFVLYSLAVKPGQVVNISTPLAQVADISKAKLTLYLDEADALDAEQKIVYIDEEKTQYKITRILHIADSKNISKYMGQIIIKSPQLFSKLVKVELKDE